MIKEVWTESRATSKAFLTPTIPIIPRLTSRMPHRQRLPILPHLRTTTLSPCPVPLRHPVSPNPKLT